MGAYPNGVPPRIRIPILVSPRDRIAPPSY
jgi:hypothetical protein